MKFLLPLLLLCGCSTLQAAESNQTDPFAILRQAYAERDADKAAMAYMANAQLRYEYGSDIEEYRGTAEIRKSFAELFSRIDPEIELDLNFRMESSEQTDEGLRQKGIYRLGFAKRDVSYGTYDVLISPNSARFVSDLSKSASREEFEMLPGPVMLDSEKEDLDQLFYGKLTGRFALNDSCDIVVTQSFVRLFARNTCTNRWQGLSRLSGLVWAGGDRVISDRKITRYEFVRAQTADFAVSGIRVTEGDQSTFAERRDASKITRVSFAAEDGVQLHGNLYVPTKKPSGKATVFVHGSGPQDRNGYASIIAVSAEELAARGNIVLTFDKRGVGQSSGDWSKMGFEHLGSDAKAAIEWLRQQPGVGEDVGLAGSSQAGWVAAKAIELGAKPDHVHLLGAAGAALTVAEQNIYNTRIRMQCAGIPSAKVEQALDQQQAFFEYVRTRKNPEKLDRLTKMARTDPAIRDWLFPQSSEIDFQSGNWFTTLEIGFDPLPVWQDYDGHAVFVFSEFDDSTPTSLAIKRLQKISDGKNGTFDIHKLDGAQHIGLKASSLCKSDLSDAVKFHGDLFSTFKNVTSDQF